MSQRATTDVSTLTAMGTPAAPDNGRFRVLVVEDDDVIGHHLQTGLQGNGYTTAWSRTGTAALAEAGRAPYDALLLDLGLPDMDGLDVARTLRARFRDLLIVILTARTDDIDIIAGLDAGADDYLVKPFSLTVLLARLRAHLRRQALTSVPDQPIHLGDLVIDPTARRCHLHDTELPLRLKEFELLTLLARHAGEAVSRDLGRELVRLHQDSRRHHGRPPPSPHQRRRDTPRPQPPASHHHTQRTRLPPGSMTYFVHTGVLQFRAATGGIGPGTTLPLVPVTTPAGRHSPTRKSQGPSANSIYTSFTKSHKSFYASMRPGPPSTRVSGGDRGARWPPRCQTSSQVTG